MIDVDERGRAAAADLNRAAVAVAGTDASLDAVLAGNTLVDVGHRHPRQGRRLAAALVGAAAIVVATVGTLVIRSGDGDRGSVVPASPVPTAVLPTSVPDQPPASTTEPAQTAVSGSTEVAQTEAPAEPPDGLRSSALVDVADAGRLPALVLAGEVGVYVDDRLVQSGSYDLAVQAPDGSVLLGPAGGGPPLVPGDPPVDLWGYLSWTGTPVLGDIAEVDGATRFTFTIGCGDGPRCRSDVFWGRPEATMGGEYLTGVAPSRAGTPLPVTFGRMSVSDTGLVVGVSTWSDGRLLHPVVVMPGPPDPTQEPSDFSVLMELLGLDPNTYNVDDPERPLAITVDQTGRVVAWITTAEVHLVDITTGERRTIPLSRRPEVPLPVLDIALTAPGLTQGALLISAPDQPAYVLDLADQSLTQIPDFTGTVTFSSTGSGAD